MRAIWKVIAVLCRWTKKNLHYLGEIQKLKLTGRFKYNMFKVHGKKNTLHGPKM